MHRIKQLRRQDAFDRRSRWWREGLVCALIGAFVGFSRRGFDARRFVLACTDLGVVTGVLGAIFGDRVLLWLK